MEHHRESREIGSGQVGQRIKTHTSLVTGVAASVRALRRCGRSVGLSGTGGLLGGLHSRGLAILAYESRVSIEAPVKRSGRGKSVGESEARAGRGAPLNFWGLRTEEVKEILQASC